MPLKRLLTSPSKTFAICLATFLFGILAGGLVPSAWWEAFLIASLASLVVSVAMHDHTRRFLCILLAIFLFAIFRVTQISLPADVPSLEQVPSSAVRVSGVVDAEAERRTARQRIVLDHVTVADTPVEGRLLVWAPLYPQIGYGDTLVFNCRMRRPEPYDGFDYAAYLNTHGILAECLRPEYIDVHPRDAFSFTASILSIKSFLLDRLQSSIAEPHASFLAGLLFGGSSSLSTDLKDDFAATGTAHILAASGYNVSLFSMTLLSFILATPLGRRRGLILTAILILGYVFAAGATPAVIRAGIMGGVVVLQKWVSRKGFVMNALLLAAALMLLVNPLLWLDVGFQLSFVATAAILSLTDRIDKRLAFVPKRLGLRTSFAASLAAILATTPIILWQFGTLSIVAPFANLLVLPFVPYAMALTLIGLLAAIVNVPIGTFTLLPAWALSWTMLTIVNFFGAVPFALVEPAHAQVLAAVSLVVTVLIIRHLYASR